MGSPGCEIWQFMVCQSLPGPALPRLPSPFPRRDAWVPVAAPRGCVLQGHGLCPRVLAGSSLLAALRVIKERAFALIYRNKCAMGLFRNTATPRLHLGTAGQKLLSDQPRMSSQGEAKVAKDNQELV